MKIGISTASWGHKTPEVARMKGKRGMESARNSVMKESKDSRAVTDGGSSRRVYVDRFTDIV